MATTTTDLRRADIVSFDGESNGLHGEVFAIGAVRMNRDGMTTSEFLARCPVSGGEVDPWVREHVLPQLADVPETHGTVLAMRNAFWGWLMAQKGLRGPVVFVGDCGWPVEAGLLSACVRDDPTRAFEGPYPLHEVGTLLLAAGLDPAGTYAPKVMRGRGAPRGPHHPLYDAEASARLTLLLLSGLDGVRAWDALRERA